MDELWLSLRYFKFLNLNPTCLALGNFKNVIYLYWLRMDVVASIMMLKVWSYKLWYMQIICLYFWHLFLLSLLMY